MDTIDIIVNKYLKFDQFGKILMDQGHSNRFVAKIIHVNVWRKYCCMNKWLIS